MGLHSLSISRHGHLLWEAGTQLLPTASHLPAVPPVDVHDRLRPVEPHPSNVHPGIHHAPRVSTQVQHVPLHPRALHTRNRLGLQRRNKQTPSTWHPQGDLNNMPRQLLCCSGVLLLTISRGALLEKVASRMYPNVCPWSAMSVLTMGLMSTLPLVSATRLTSTVGGSAADLGNTAGSGRPGTPGI